MRRVVALCSLITVIVLVRCTPANANNYPLTGKVTELHLGTNTVVVKDGAGNKWAFRGIDDWFLEDTVSMIMSDNGTPDNIKDDKVVDVRYSALD